VRITGHIPLLDANGMEARMDAIRLKQMLGGTLTDQELMCLQFEQNGFGCGTCSSPGYLVDGRSDLGAFGEG
jgi:hypothetical protein